KQNSCQHAQIFPRASHHSSSAHRLYHHSLRLPPSLPYTRSRQIIWENFRTMKFRRFGRTGWQVSEMGYGMWGTAGWTALEDKESLNALQRSIDLGCNFFDTAWAYGDGHSEELLGKTLRANSGKKLYVATKVPPKNRRWPALKEFSLDDCYPPDYVFEYVDKSLKNLVTDSLDL